MRIGSIKKLVESYNPGAFLSDIPAEDMAKLAKFINTFTGFGCDVVFSSDGSCAIYVGRNISFAVIQSSQSGTSLVVSKGFCQYAGGSYQAKAGVTLTGITATGQVYISLELSTGVFSDATFAAGTAPASDDDTQVFILADITVAGGRITEIHQRHYGDCVETRA